MARISKAILERVCTALAARVDGEPEPLQRLWSGYGQIVRLRLSGPVARSVIIKHVQPPAAPPGEAQRSHARKLRSYDVELNFYAHYAQRCRATCRVAQPLLCERLGDTPRGWLFVLEDLDAAGFAERRASLPLHGVRACLAWLAHFHATFLGDAAEGLHAVGTYWHLETRPDELARMHDRELRDAAGWLDARLRGARYRTLVHGDAKVENFCFSADLARVAAVDFQYVGRGCGMQDVAYFFSSCLDHHTLEEHAAPLLDFYFAQLRAALPPELDADALEAEWRDLYPAAWADFCRFMNGWAPAHPMRTGYAARMTTLALTAEGS